MGDVFLRTADYGHIAADGLARGFDGVGQPAAATVDRIVISPRPVASRYLTFTRIATGPYKPEAFTDAFLAIDSRVNRGLTLTDLANQAEGRAAVGRWLDQRLLHQLTHKLLTPPGGPDERYVFLRDIVLPVFFEKYPRGHLACVQYDPRINTYLAMLSTLKRAEILNSADPKVIAQYLGDSALSSFGLNVPAELISLMLSFASAIFFPGAYSFVASCEHLYFLIFVTDVPISVSQDDDRYPPLVELVPRLASVLDAKERDSALHLSERFVRSSRSFPFNRRTYDPDSICLFLEGYVANVDSLLGWLCEATNFVASDGAFDVDFAFQTYLTVYMLLNMSYRVVFDEIDMFTRKSTFFDVLELYAALIDCSIPANQAAAWAAHLSPAFYQSVLSVIASYPDPFGADLVAATESLWKQNLETIASGLIYGTATNGDVNVPGIGAVAFSHYAVELLRTLRNTKHGFAIRKEEYLWIHSGAFGNDLPDYVVSLWLNFIADRSSYPLQH